MTTVMTTMTKQWRVRVAQPKTSVRPICPTDAEMIHEMHQWLSPESLYYRYLQYRTPTLAEIEVVCRMRPETGAGFVASVQTSLQTNAQPNAQPNKETPKGKEKIVGIAYYVIEAGEKQRTAEPGILIEDQFQGQGIGRRLWQRTQQHAKSNHVRWLRVLFHPSNQRMLRLMQSIDLPHQARYTGGLSEYLVSLGERASPLPIQRVMGKFGGPLIAKEVNYQSL